MALQLGGKAIPDGPEGDLLNDRAGWAEEAVRKATARKVDAGQLWGGQRDSP